MCIIKYDEKINNKNKNKFNKSDLFNEKAMNELKFNCVICARKTSLLMSTSILGDKLVCRQCEIDVFKNDYDKLIQFQEKGGRK